MFAMSGALAASDKNMYKDLFGLSFTGFATAVGGGTLRDIILGAHPIAWVEDNNYLSQSPLALYSRSYLESNW